jgi:hypothetical protein
MDDGKVEAENRNSAQGRNNYSGITYGRSYPDTAKEIVYRFVAERLEKTDTHVTFNRSNVYIVQFTYILGNWKALISTTLPDGMYYEVTFNAVRDEAYVDSYKKFENVRIGLGPIEV